MANLRSVRRWCGVLGIGVLLVAGAAACDRNDDVDSLSATYGLPSNRVDLEAETWVLVRADSTPRIGGREPVTLEVDGDHVSGAAPCNRYRGTLDLDGDDLSITGIAQTMRACDESVMRADERFVAALEAVDTIDVSDEDLELTNGDGVRLVFRPQDD